jgi:hypothetical protein
MKRRYIEPLEPRQLLAGNISAVLQGADLVIQGDDLANTLSVSQSAPDRVNLRTIAPDERFPDTNINFFSTSLQFENVTGAIIVRMRGGDDRVFFTGGRFQGTVTVDLGLGNDRAEIGRDSVRLERGLDVQLGGGQDTYLQTNVRVGQNLSIDGGIGGDGVTLRSSSVGGSLAINGAAGFDAIRLDRTAVGAATGILGGSEGDRIETIYSAFAAGVSILGGAGGDIVELVGSRFDTTLFVALEADLGAATVQGSIIGGSCWLTAAGQADLRFQSSRAGRLEIITGPSHDTVIVDRSALDMLFVSLGEGNDVLRVTGNQIAAGGLFDGQGGIDSLFERIITLGAGRLGFENVDMM